MRERGGRGGAAHLCKNILRFGFWIRFRAEKATQNGLRSLALKPRPESGPDSLICAMFARERSSFGRWVGGARVTAPCPPPSPPGPGTIATRAYWRASKRKREREREIERERKRER